MTIAEILTLVAMAFSALGVLSGFVWWLASIHSLVLAGRDDMASLKAAMGPLRAEVTDLRHVVNEHGHRLDRHSDVICEIQSATNQHAKTLAVLSAK